MSQDSAWMSESSNEHKTKNMEFGYVPGFINMGQRSPDFHYRARINSHGFLMNFVLYRSEATGDIGSSVKLFGQQERHPVRTVSCSDSILYNDKASLIGRHLKHAAGAITVASNSPRSKDGRPDAPDAPKFLPAPRPLLQHDAGAETKRSPGRRRTEVGRELESPPTPNPKSARFPGPTEPGQVGCKMLSLPPSLLPRCRCPDPCPPPSFILPAAGAQAPALLHPPRSRCPDTCPPLSSPQSVLHPPCSRCPDTCPPSSILLAAGAQTPALLPPSSLQPVPRHLLSSILPAAYAQTPALLHPPSSPAADAQTPALLHPPSSPAADAQTPALLHPPRSRCPDTCPSPSSPQPVPRHLPSSILHPPQQPMPRHLLSSILPSAGAQTPALLHPPRSRCPDTPPLCSPSWSSILPTVGACTPALLHPPRSWFPDMFPSLSSPQLVPRQVSSSILPAAGPPSSPKPVSRHLPSSLHPPQQPVPRHLPSSLHPPPQPVPRHLPSTILPAGGAQTPPLLYPPPAGPPSSPHNCPASSSPQPQPMLRHLPSSILPAAGAQTPALLPPSSPAADAQTPALLPPSSPAAGAQTPALLPPSSPAAGAQTPALLPPSSPAAGAQTPALLPPPSPAAGAQTPALLHPPHSRCPHTCPPPSSPQPVPASCPPPSSPQPVPRHLPSSILRAACAHILPSSLCPACSQAGHPPFRGWPVGPPDPPATGIIPSGPGHP
ncbi:basic proline-rich protein-like [Tachyglossus aculeatus]|uniref:basic proline-rich protein-like n=1 Tax=Tachyglossus aculeatus TaxID=9261 RepID=UPI0018F7B02B|nr:basic proline-rich protein-like [Tachyglossus aculeatus]